MDKRPAPWLWVCLAMLLLMTGCQRDKSSAIFDEHIKTYPDIRKKYIYQSILRIANVRQDPNFDLLIRDVRKIIIYQPPREDSTYQIKDLRSHIRGSGYDELIDIRTASGDRINLFLNESTGKGHFVGLLDSSGKDDYVFEIDGTLNLEYLSSVTMADGQSLMDLLN